MLLPASILPWHRILEGLLAVVHWLISKTFCPLGGAAVAHALLTDIVVPLHKHKMDTSRDITLSL